MWSKVRDVVRSCLWAAEREVEERRRKDRGGRREIREADEGWGRCGRLEEN